MPAAVFFLLPLLLLAQDQPPAQCVISGTVVNSITAEPLDKVDIEAEPSGKGAPATAATDAQGHFTFSNLEPGQYRLKARRNRFLDTYYGARRAESTGIPIALEPGQTLKDITFKLHPFGVIAGTIRDPEGEPLARMTVTALRVKFEDGRRKVTAVDSAYTDELGQYRITGLAPGKYYVRAEPKMKGPAGDFAEGQFTLIIEEPAAKLTHQPAMLLPALYPGVQSPDAARTVDLEIGARVTGVDIALPRSGTVSVKGHVTAPQSVAGGMVNLNRGQWMGNALDSKLTTTADENGDFTFPAVPQGLYTLTASGTIATFERIRMYSNGALALNGGVVSVAAPTSELKGQVPLEVGTTPITGVHVTLSAAAQVTGRVLQASDSTPLPNGQVAFDDGVNDIRYADLNDGNFALDLPPGRYLIYLNTDILNQEERLLLHSATWSGRDVATEGLTITEGGKVALEVIAAPDGGKLEGVALTKDDKTNAGATVVLIPESKFRARNDRYYRTETDQYGRFTIGGIIPGDYKAYAWDDIEPGIWRDADFVKSIESKGEAVTIKTGSHESVKLK
jgi:hypothetical protein